jgi:hypothetical protein
MKCANAMILAGFLLVAAGMVAAQEQTEENPRLNTNLGLPISVPLNPIGRFSGPGAGLIYGAGYNFSRHHSVTGEFMYDWLNPGGGAFTPIRAALQNNNISGHSNLYSLTANYRFELRGKALGMYFIAGGGWYIRRAKLTKVVQTGTTTSCTSAWLYWGYTCTSGIVTADQTLASASSSTLGANGGIGFTVRVGDAPYRIYVESRYHYAPTRNINTQLVMTTVGIRY